jgi:hypothetical protein
MGYAAGAPQTEKGLLGIARGSLGFTPTRPAVALTARLADACPLKTDRKNGLISHRQRMTGGQRFGDAADAREKRRRSVRHDVQREEIERIGRID